MKTKTAVVLTLLLSAAVTASALGAYHRWVVLPMHRIGVVDVGDLYRIKEAEFTKLLTQTTSEVERDKAFSLAREFSRRLPKALEELPRDCDCLVLLKSALAGSTQQTLDLTAHLKAKLEAP